MRNCRSASSLLIAVVVRVGRQATKLSWTLVALRMARIPCLSLSVAKRTASPSAKHSWQPAAQAPRTTQKPKQAKKRELRWLLHWQTLKLLPKCKARTSKRVSQVPAANSLRNLMMKARRKSDPVHDKRAGVICAHQSDLAYGKCDATCERRSLESPSYDGAGHSWSMFVVQLLDILFWQLVNAVACFAKVCLWCTVLRNCRSR